MRTRVFDNRNAIAMQWRWGSTISNPNPLWNTGMTTGGPVTTITDNVNTRFKERSAAGEVINTPFSKSTETVTRGFGPYLLSQVNNTTTGDRGFGDLTKIAFPAAYGPSNMASLATSLGIPTDHSDMVTRVGTDAMAKVGEAKNPFLVSGGELGETLKYLRNPLQQGLKLAASIERKLSQRVLRGGRWQPGLLARRSDLTSTKSISEELSGLYLETMYGMRPLVKEVSEVLSAVSERKLWNQPRRETVRSQEKASWSGSKTQNNSESGISFLETLTYKKEVLVRSGCMYHFMWDLESSNRYWGTRLTDIPSALWALTPSSFVIDWFVNTNRYIAALTPVAGLTRDAHWTTISVTQEVTRSATNFAVGGWLSTTRVSSGSPSKFVSEEVNRTPTIKVGLVPSRVSSGLLDLSLSQSTSLLAMTTQRLLPLIRDIGRAIGK